MRRSAKTDELRKDNDICTDDNFADKIFTVHSNGTKGDTQQRLMNLEEMTYVPTTILPIISYRS